VLKDLWEQSSLGKALEVIAEEQGWERGWVRGWEQGWKRGRLKGFHESIRIILTSRFGRLPDDLTDAIENADEAICTIVLVHVGTDTLDQIRGLINLGPVGSA